MEFRKSIKSDLDNIMIIIKEAQKYFKENNIDQWQDNYPNEETILNDINNETSYVLVKDNNIVATASISFEEEKTYKNIDGNWLTNDRYVVIHRIAVSNDYKGLRLSSTILDNAKALALKNSIHSIKIDTHKDNKAMQRVLKKK